MRLNMMLVTCSRNGRRKRRGRGIGSGIGKTAGRGHKGQKSRAGGKAPMGFEGGQMPLHRRLPKVGFACSCRFAGGTVRLGDLYKVAGDRVTLDGLKSAGLVAKSARSGKIVLSGWDECALVIDGLSVSRGARLAIESAGGQVVIA